VKEVTRHAMKQTLLFFLAMIALSACASRPSIEDSSREHMKDQQMARDSDAFARSLPQ